MDKVNGNGKSCSFKFPTSQGSFWVVSSLDWKWIPCKPYSPCLLPEPRMCSNLGCHGNFLLYPQPYMASLKIPVKWENEICHHPQSHSSSTERSLWASPLDHVFPAVIYPEAILVASSPVLVTSNWIGYFLFLCSYNISAVNPIIWRQLALIR